MDDSPDSIEELPIFPLPIVLFPGAVIPLHIFEDRYKSLMKYAIDNKGRFGLSYKKNAAVGKETPPEVGSVGCAAAINAVMPLDQGQMNIISTGLVRYRITGLRQRTPFVIARIELFSDDPEPRSDLSRLHSDTRDLAEQFLVAIQSLKDDSLPGEPDLPEDPEALSLFVSSALPFENDGKQRLLEMTSTRLRLTRIRHHLLSSLPNLNERVQKHQSAKHNGHGKLDVK